MAVSWVEYKSNNGQIYYYNSQTNETSWDKPDELRTPAERILSACPWREVKSADSSSKVYYYNKITNQTTWNKPPELEEAERNAAALENGIPPPPPITGS